MSNGENMKVSLKIKCSVLSAGKMCQGFFFIGVFFVCLGNSQPVRALDGEMIIKQVEENLNGKTAILNISMTVKTSRTERTMKMESYSQGKNKSFIKLLYPKKDKGITFLKLDKVMWQYIPRIEKTMKIPASMMLQSWMGSDFTNDDLVRESSISEDYLVKEFGEDGENYQVLLEAREEAPVVWGFIQMDISKQYKLPVRVQYFDEDKQLIRILYYRGIKKFGDRYYPGSWVMEPRNQDKSGHLTLIEINEAVFDREIGPQYFTKRALKKFSK